MIYTTLGDSMSSITMNRIGSNTSGGTIETTAKNPTSVVRIWRRRPINSLNRQGTQRLPLRLRLNAASCQSRICSVRRSASINNRCAASITLDGAGSSLPDGFSSKR